MAPYSLGEKVHIYVLILCLYSAIQYRVDARDSSQDFIAGLLAWKRLLKGSTPLLTKSNTYRLYEKSGTFDDALKDFYSVSPKHIQFENDKGHYIQHRINQGKIVTGYVGDKMLRVVENGGKFGKFRPTLDVIGNETPDAPYIDKIIYKSVDE